MNLLCSIVLLAAVSASGPGDLVVNQPPSTVVAKGGAITLHVRYSCVQYAAPYSGGTDIILGSITSPAGSLTGSSYDGVAWVGVVCDGTTRRLDLSLHAVNGGLSGPANLQFGHEGFSPDGSIGYISVYVNSPVIVTR